MKRIVSILIAIMLFSSPAFGLVSTKEIFKRIIFTADKLENMGSQILFSQLDNIDRDSVDTQTYPLKSGNSYIIIALGDDERVQDIDLEVLDENNNVVGRDADGENIAIVEVRPKWSGIFKIRVSGYEMSSSDAFYGIIIARTN